MTSDPNSLGRLTRVKNKKPRGNEKSDYLATKLDFPDHGVMPVMFLRDELRRPLARALLQKDDMTETQQPTD